jgi:glycerol-3-phosphate dehydrogenase
VQADHLSPGHRAAALADLQATTPERPLDVLVVGGGVVGCGAALDAAARGLSVGLVEMHDLAAGTSSRSSRLAHGGLRYLEQREFGLVREALTERGLLLDRLAPHLVRPVPFLFPVGRQWERPYVASGVHLYDLLSRVGAYGGAMPRPKSLTRLQAKAMAPDLDTGEMAGAIRYHDAQIDDARHTVAVARTAAAHGARILTGTAVTGLVRDGERVIGVQARDTESGAAFWIYARVVVGAVGVWTDDLIRLAEPAAPTRVRQSKGVHLVIPGACFRSTSAVIARTPTSVLFLLPWSGNWLVGTTDTPWEDAELADPRATEHDIAYLIGQANRWLARPLERADVIATYAGLRPLLAAGGEDDPTATLSREHSVFQPAPGMVLIAGGKYTTYRVMAQDVIDVAAEQLQSEGTIVPRSTTADIPLVGAVGFARDWQARAAIAADSGLTVEQVEVLLRRHGDHVTEVLDAIAAEPALAEPVTPGSTHLRAEARVAVTTQGARTLEDVLVRRLRVAVEVPDHGRAAARAVLTDVANALGWSDSRAADELASVEAALVT